MSNSRRTRRHIRRHQQASPTPLWLDLHDAPMPVSESVAAPERTSQRQAVQEVGAVEAPRGERPGRMLVQLIRAGWSLNDRYYPAEVLRRDGPGAFPGGTQAFIDHATEDEDAERPAGSVRNLAAVLTEGARWDEERKALVGEVRLFAPWREALADMADHIGMSIRAWITGDMGQAEGRSGFVVDSIPEGRSVDFVTVPAAGGRIVSILESAQPKAANEARNVGAWLESRLHLALTQLGDNMYGDGRLTRDERIALSAAIGDALQAWTARVEADAPQLFQRDLFDEPETPDQPAEEARQAAEAPAEDTRARLQRAVRDAHGDGERPFVWVLDFDPDQNLVWFEDDDRLWQQSYTLTDGQVSLADGRVEVVRRTTFEPVADSSGGDEAAESPATQPVTRQQVVEQVEPLPVAEVATELSRLDRLLGHTPQVDVPASAGAGQNAGGSPPTAQIENEEAPMSGTQDGARAPDQAGTASEARTTNTTEPQSATEAQVAVVAQERDQYRARANSLAEALTESQNARQNAEAQRDQAVTEMRRYRANETGRQTVDRLLVASESGVPENLQSFIAPRVHAAVHNQVPLTDAGEVNQDALESLVASAIRTERVHAAQLLEAQGVGTVRGLGAEGDPTMQMTAEQFDKQASTLLADIGLDDATVQLAVKGR